MAYIPRLSDSGIANNPYWYSDNPFYVSGYGMPNCTCYCYGRWYELLQQKPTMLPLGNAGTWYDDAPSTINKGSTPQLGAIIVYYDPYGYYDGHVAVVEQIKANGDLLTSNSGWGGSFFFTDDAPVASNYVPTWAQSRGYKVKGFLYLPGSTPGATWEWVKGNRYLTQVEQDNNAVITASYLSSKGWSRSAIAGLLGNLRRESTLNPGIWQNLTVDPSNGYGLAQWTPSTKWTNYAASQSWGIDDGYKQLDFINIDPLGEYISTSTHPETLAQFKASSGEPL